MNNTIIKLDYFDSNRNLVNSLKKEYQAIDFTDIKNNVVEFKESIKLLIYNPNNLEFYKEFNIKHIDVLLTQRTSTQHNQNLEFFFKL